MKRAWLALTIVALASPIFAESPADKIEDVEVHVACASCAPRGLSAPERREILSRAAEIKIPPELAARIAADLSESGANILDDERAALRALLLKTTYRPIGAAAGRDLQIVVLSNASAPGGASLFDKTKSTRIDFPDHRPVSEAQVKDSVQTAGGAPTILAQAGLAARTNPHVFHLTASVREPAVAAEPPAPRKGAPQGPGGVRAASVFIAERFINDQIRERFRSAYVTDLAISLEPEKSWIVARGIFHFPLKKMKTVGVPPILATFRFQVTITLKASRQGYVIMIFPMDQTYFYSLGAPKDRIIVPVELLQLGLGSMAGELSELSGDAAPFDEQAADLRRQIAADKKKLAGKLSAKERAAAADDLTIAKNNLKNVPPRRRQAQRRAEEFENLLSFVGEKELNVNNELRARRNTLVIKMKVDQLAPYLKGIELGGVRVVKDDQGGSDENFLAIDLNSVTK